MNPGLLIPILPPITLNYRPYSILIFAKEKSERLHGGGDI